MAKAEGVSRSPLSLVKAATDRVRLPVVYASVGIVVGVLYFGSFLGPAKDALLPAAIGILAAFTVRSLQSIESQTGVGEEGTYPTVLAALPQLETFVSRDREVTDIKVIAATGWTTTRQLLPRLCTESPARHVRVAMHVVDNAGPFKDVYPSHWCEEVDRTLARLQRDYTDPRFELAVSAYTYLPAFHGILINDNFLLIGFFAWDTSSVSPELSGAEQPHRLYRRGDPSSSQLFEVFDAWFRYGPQRLLVTLPSP